MDSEKPSKWTVFNLRLSQEDRRILNLMAELKGVQPSVLVRMWIKENLRKFGEKLDSNGKTR